METCLETSCLETLHSGRRKDFFASPGGRNNTFSGIQSESTIPVDTAVDTRIFPSRSDVGKIFAAASSLAVRTEFHHLAVSGRSLPVGAVPAPV